MYTIISQLRNIRKIFLLGFLSLSSLSVMGQVEGSALDHLLQRRPVAKHYEDKKFGDHLFVEGGMGVNTTFVGFK
jgi:hypothetical protein